MDPVLKLVIEGSCLVGVGLLAIFSMPLLAGKPPTASIGVRIAVVIAGGIVYLFINPRGGPDPFPVVVGGSIFVAGLLGLYAAGTLVWRFSHGGGDTLVAGQTARDFGGMVLLAVFAAASLVGVVIFGVLTLQALAEDVSYRNAPLCSSNPSAPCRSQTEAAFERVGAETSRGPYWIEVAAGGRSQRIEIDWATNLAQTLVPGETVQLTSWQGKITQVTVPGGATMQAADSPGYNLFLGCVFTGLCLFLLLMFGFGGLVYRMKWMMGTRGFYIPDAA